MGSRLVTFKHFTVIVIKEYNWINNLLVLNWFHPYGCQEVFNSKFSCEAGMEWIPNFLIRGARVSEKIIVERN